MQTPLDQLIEQINRAANEGLHLLAIGMAVALPAICSSLEKEDGRSDCKDYIRWCKTNLVGGNFSFITAEQMYSIRCGVLHSGRADITNKSGSPDDSDNGIKRVIFMPPGPFTSTSGQINDAYTYSVIEFCKNMGQAIMVWYEANKNDKFINANIGKMMSYHPNGLTPYVSGVSVIA